jgi:hypothetical protein
METLLAEAVGVSQIGEMDEAYSEESMTAQLGARERDTYSKALLNLREELRCCVELQRVCGNQSCMLLTLFEGGK